MGLQEGDVTDLCGGSSTKRNKVIEVGNFSLWSELPAVLLELILKRVGVIEYFLFGCVCKPWRSVAIALKQEFMASQAPLVFLKLRKARKHCYFYNIFDDRLYRVAVPHLRGSRCLGFTCGYLVLEATEKEENLWLVNPFTRHELKFPIPPNGYNDVILASLAKSSSEFVVVASSRSFPFLQFCRSGDVNWTVCDYKYHRKQINGVGQSWTIIDVAVFKGKIYVLSNHGEIGTLNLNSDPKVTLLHVKSVYAAGDGEQHLVASHDGLYLAKFYPNHSWKIHKLDFERMEWESVNLKDQALFLGKLKCCGLSFLPPSRQHFDKHLNPVFYLGLKYVLKKYTALYVAGRLSKYVPATPEDWKLDIFLSSPLWYFPHLSSTVDSVYDD